MLDIKLLRSNPDQVIENLLKRKVEPSLVKSFLEKDKAWRKDTEEADKLRNLRKQKSKTKPSSLEEIETLKKLSNDIKTLEEKTRLTEQELKDILLQIPNIPDSNVPHGQSDQDNKVVRTVGQEKAFDFEPRDHAALASNLDIVDFPTATKIAGARFALYKGTGALLERALINFMLDIHTREHNYLEVIPPFLVNTDSLEGTGQLPKFAEDLFVCEKDNLWLIPTAEVPLTNIHRNEIIPVEQLPLKYTAYTPCFRREAGSYGKDVKGLIRQHQFNKVELVKFTRPEDSEQGLELLTSDAEKILKLLNLPYRVVELCAGDLGFSAAKTYDLEVWFPSQNCYREISSCSNFRDFQARRAGIRFKRDRDAKSEFVHTLNGSGLAIGRTFAAILENYQTEKGHVEIPDILLEFTKGLKIIS